MYLSNKSASRLDELIKGFEVAYRSYVVDIVKTNFPTQLEFENHLKSSLRSIGGTSIYNLARYKQKIARILTDVKGQFDTIESCYSAFLTQSVPDNSRVPYISTIIDYIEIFFDPYFKNSQLFKGFTAKDFLSLSYQFHRVRNELSHPASSRISINTSKEIIRFIEKNLLNLDPKYFWYKSNDNVKVSIADFLSSISGPTIRINNIGEIAYTHKKLIQRQNELTTLKEFLFGKEGFRFYRKARSVVVYGYGGLGKTALVLEFINEIVKDCMDGNRNDIDFLLYFTAKEEELTLSNNNQFQINELKKQIFSYDSFIKNLYQYLKIKDKSDLFNLRGILIIDNIETLKEDKKKIIDFIQTLPDSIQVILTSREEEAADSKIALKGFEKIEAGITFLKEYIDEYNLSFEYQDEFSKIATSAKGNTLILVLALLRLNENIESFQDILNELNSTSSTSIGAVANFMYKNTFDQSIAEIEKRGINSKKILSVIAYYNEPIDLYALAKLSNISSIPILESVCDVLLQKLVLTKKNESYEINEFASKFIIVKIIPNKIEAQFLTNQISEFKFERRRTLRSLEENRSNSKLNNIMEDWAPRNNIEKIAIAEAYNLYFSLSARTRDKKSSEKYIIEKFSEIESYSQHPYVKFQKARIFSRLLKNSFKKEYSDIVTKSYEEAIFSIKFDYQYISHTQSFAVVLWLYAMFLIDAFEEYTIAARNLEEAKAVCENLGIKNDNYAQIVAHLQRCYQHLYRKTKNKAFLSRNFNVR